MHSAVQFYGSPGLQRAGKVVIWNTTNNEASIEHRALTVHESKMRFVMSARGILSVYEYWSSFANLNGHLYSGLNFFFWLRISVFACAISVLGLK